MQFVRLKNWEQYQHYKNRNPVWIKLYQDLLTSQMWVACDDASRTLAVACMVLAAKTGNKIPANPAYLRRVAYLNADPNFAPLEACGFLEIIEDSENASNVLAVRYQDASLELEKRREEKKTLLPPSGAFLRFWSSWPKSERKQAQGKCWSLWQRSDFDLQADLILAHVEGQRGSDGWAKGFIPAPLTYLNQRRWEGADEAEAPQQRRPQVAL